MVLVQPFGLWQFDGFLLKNFNKFAAMICVFASGQ